MVIFEALFECHGILISCKSPIKLMQRPYMTIAVDWDVKHQFIDSETVYGKVQVGKDQEKAQSEKDSHSKNRGGKKPN